MITKDNFKDVLLELGFKESEDILYKEFSNLDTLLKVDFKEEKLIYPSEETGFEVAGEFTTSFTQNENFVVFECVHRLFEKGYRPNHITIEPKWKVGHGASGGRADILVKDNTQKSLLIIECKTAGREFQNEWNNTQINGGQIFSYAKQAGSTQFICLYTSDLIDKEVIYNNFIITLKDNENLLTELVDKKPLSYRDAKILDKEDIFRAWKETYAGDFSTKGIFEKDIPAYIIGKNKYSLSDLNQINSRDIQGKYHEFATVLRQHNVSGRENAFDKLVNLFLCKIVDEKNNPEELKFYWRGIAYDDYFQLQDRLQKLYQEGMQRFLGEEVTYVDNKEIDKAFHFFKNDPDATRDLIKNYFRQLKFFTNNDFAFIDVHNEKLFYQNSEVLLKIVLMLQDIQLKSNEENQFLGDMFEGFLDQGVKQSEGQFFTPMPIVKFILSSLPLEKIIIESEEIPRVIDYACGAGHFLNEYAQQVKPFVEKHTNTEVAKYYKEIVGIEKEYRLSKVAKVSAFMYGQDDIQIIYSDALGKNQEIEDGKYSLLVANPPYSVKGFLETLTATERNKYELISKVNESNFSNNNSIEAFFIERAEQLLKPGGYAAIIVPSSILTKGKVKSTSKLKNIYVSTREILLKHFDIVGIAQLSGGTFGKTGTSTVTLFLRKKQQNPESAKHYLNRVNEWFNGDFTKTKIFQDEYYIEKYCSHLELIYNDYLTFLFGDPNDDLLGTDIFKDYKKEFDKWPEIKRWKKQRSFKALNKVQQEAELKKRFLKYTQDIEKEKLYYFILTTLNPQKVLIINSPPNSKKGDLKNFLGYEWSSKKGNEGIKYLGSTDFEEQDSVDDEGNIGLEEEDKRVLSNIFNLANISTPLYDPNNLDNNWRINYLIKQNFKGEAVEIPEKLEAYVTSANLENLIDFSKPDFNKAFSLNGDKIVMGIQSKYPYIRVSSLLKDIEGEQTRVNEDRIRESGTYPVVTQESNNLIYGYTDAEKPVTDLPLVLFGDHTFVFKFINFNFVKGADGTQLLKFENSLFTEYFYHLAQTFILNDAKYERHFKYLKDLKIPVPPPEVQEQIVKLCKEIDEEMKEAEKVVIEQKGAITAIINEMENQGYPQMKVGGIAEINPPKTDLRGTDDNILVSFVEMSSVSEEGYITHKEDKLLKDVKNSSYTYFKEGDIIIAKITPCMENGKCAVATGLTNSIGFGSSEFHVLRINEKISSNKYVFAFINREVVRLEAEKKMTGSSGHKRVPEAFYKGLEIPVPKNKKIQADFISRIEKCEMVIKSAQEIINKNPKRKEKVINEYL